jgi:hypothetical protein
MKHRLLKTVLGAGSLIFLGLFISCGQKEADLGKEVLIRVGDRNLTVLEFNDAFEIAKIAYDDNIRRQPEDLRDAQIRLLHELTVEMILLEEAHKLEIQVTDSELEKAVAEIKSDYPEGEFEKTLLEFAVSYDSWKNRLKNRLIINKVIEEELASKITISPEDITEYYQEHYQGKEAESESGQSSDDMNEAIVKQLRRQKAEENYHAWIETLRSQYDIEVNDKLWEKLTGSKRVEENEKTVGNDPNNG